MTVARARLWLWILVAVLAAPWALLLLVAGLFVGDAMLTSAFEWMGLW